MPFAPFGTLLASLAIREACFADRRGPSDAGSAQPALPADFCSVPADGVNTPQQEPTTPDMRTGCGSIAMYTRKYRRLAVVEVDGVTVIRFLDQIIADGNIEQLRRELFNLVETGNREKILVNFSQVDFISSAVLAMLITLLKRLRACDGSLRLSNIRPEILEMFAYTHLDRLFDITDNEADALAGFQAGT
jgi:anti-sigma B factor antagonist